MTAKVSSEVKQAYWNVSQGGMNITKACKEAGIFRSTLYRYKPFQEWRNSIKAR